MLVVRRLPACRQRYNDDGVGGSDGDDNIDAGAGVEHEQATGLQKTKLKMRGALIVVCKFLLSPLSVLQVAVCHGHRCRYHADAMS